MRKCLIISNWFGFEIDSSEHTVNYSAGSDPLNFLRCCIQSPYFMKKIECDILKYVKQAMKIADFENKELLESLEIEGQSLLRIIQKFNEDPTDREEIILLFNTVE